MWFSPRLLTIFVLCLIPCVIIKSYLDSVLSTFYSFLLVHVLILPFCFKNLRTFSWYILTIAHGMAHVMHPAFYGTTRNLNYTPLYDFTVHGLQCLCTYYYSKDMFPVGVATFGILMTGSLLAHLDNAFMGNPFWLFVSGCGVFGVQWHMMLLNENKDPSIFWTSAFIWSTPYLGYLNFDFIPYWDSVVNSACLFSMWFLNWFITLKIYNYYK